MSKREGIFVTLNEIIDQVGKDPLRYYMISTKNETSIDFDINKVIEKGVILKLDNDIEGIVPFKLLDYKKWKHSIPNFLLTITTIIVNFFLAFMLVSASDWTNANNFGLLHCAGGWAVRLLGDTSVYLFYNNSLKLQTTSGGVTVTGGATATTFVCGTTCLKSPIVCATSCYRINGSGDMSIYVGSSNKNATLFLDG